MTVHCGDCRAVMAAMEPESVDAIVTDPPYDLTAVSRNGSSRMPGTGPYGRHTIGTKTGGFMGKEWDGTGIAFQVETWRAALRVLKPGGHLLAFGGTRTFHRMAVAIEDAGFEIRDTLMYLYGSGFPKSHNLDRYRGSAFCACTTGTAIVPLEHGQSPSEHHLRSMRSTDLPAPVNAQDQCGEVLQPCVPQQGASATVQQLPGDGGQEQSSVEGRRNVLAEAGELPANQVRASTDVGHTDGAERRLCDGASSFDGAEDRAVTGAARSHTPQRPQPAEQRSGQPRIVAGQPESQTGGAWPICSQCGLPIIPRGLGTSLKPAYEPVILARKPLIGTVAANVQAYGTGALNVDACRIEGSKASGSGQPPLQFSGTNHRPFHDHAEPREFDTTKGRWPANLVLDEDAAALLDEQSGTLTSGSWSGHRNKPKTRNAYGTFALQDEAPVTGDSGGASRFFYVAKASRSERNVGLEGMPAVVRPITQGHGRGPINTSKGDGTGIRENAPTANHHPTVKPIALMRWLCRLITPPDGLILDPFAGSGSTGCAAALEGFQFVGIEQDAEYSAIAERRIAYWAARREPEQIGLAL